MACVYCLTSYLYGAMTYLYDAITYLYGFAAHSAHSSVKREPCDLSQDYLHELTN